ncbi:hypothetical protein [Streptomyces sp. MUM 178J]|uniref:hypothetical protein n=1 Tax=Streptomyces sp. MUM 178J TaxID=2791991 RepID=UPI001F04CB73|nr:hypothetical protein [Streptomyces sp. MUM 178J]WRQ81093.1 hypothetical protein I3F59_018035 [Streptomyces sp. MUM 178J]
MDMQAVAERADAMLDATIDAVDPEVQWAHDDTTARSCDVTRRRTVMTVISEERRGSFLGLIERFWSKSGYEISSVNQDREHPAIFAKSRDGFQLTLTVGDKGQVFLKVTTPCVQRSGVAEPSATPNGPAYSGVEIPYPNVHSDFWSAKTPVPASPGVPQGSTTSTS